MEQLIFIALLGLIAGLSIGCIGIGGVILVPGLFYLAGIPIKTAIAAQGFTLVCDPIIGDGVIYCVMKEGYIVARLWPSEAYCAFDVNLWGNSHKMKDLQKANESMMDWMKGFGDRFTSDEILNGGELTEEKQMWLNEEEKKVIALREQINMSIENAEKLLK